MHIPCHLHDQHCLWWISGLLLLGLLQWIERHRGWSKSWSIHSVPNCPGRWWNNGLLGLRMHDVEHVQYGHFCFWRVGFSVAELMQCHADEVEVTYVVSIQIADNVGCLDRSRIDRTLKEEFDTSSRSSGHARANCTSFTWVNATVLPDSNIPRIPALTMLTSKVVREF